MGVAKANGGSTLTSSPTAALVNEERDGEERRGEDG